MMDNNIFKMLISLCFIFSIHNPTYGMDKKVGIYPTPIKSTAMSYDGYQLDEPILDVQVQLCTSLGEACNARIAGIIKESDEFVVAFMYRFDSPVIIDALANKNLESRLKKDIVPTLVFLDHDQSLSSSKYGNYIRRLLDTVPSSLVKLGSKAFHQKVIVCKKRGQQAKIVVGSANATYEAENVHSEDSLIVESNKLARIYLDEFHKLMTMKVQKSSVEVFHENRLHMGESNLDNLKKLSFLIPMDLEDKDASDGEFRHVSHKATIVSLGLSTGFKGGAMRCMEIVEKILSEANKYVFLFENYLTLPPETYASFWKLLTNSTPKLIVLDDDKKDEEDEKSSNTRTFQTLSTTHTTLLFNPFTGGKFHHKLIIRFPKEGNAEVYTGSFHISKSAMDSNSENIIGIVSEELAQECLATILWQSGLANRREVWDFGIVMPELITSNTSVRVAAQKIYLNMTLNIERNLDRILFVLGNLISFTHLGVETTKVEEFKEKFARSYGKEDNFGKIKLLKEGKELIFANLLAIYKALNEYASLALKLPNPPALPVFVPKDLKDVTQWLEGMKEWVEKATEETKSSITLQKMKSPDIKEIRDRISEIDHTCSIFEAANDCVDTFKNMSTLCLLLEKYLKSEEIVLPSSPRHEPMELSSPFKSPPPKEQLRPLKRVEKEEAKETPLPKKGHRIAPYSDEDLSQFLKFLLAKDIKASTISESTKEEVSYQNIGKMAKDPSFGKTEVKKKIWEDLKISFKNEFEEWHEKEKSAK